MATSIIRFYSQSTPSQTNRPGRDFTLQDYLSWDDDTLEIRHDYIQHVFPLPESSGFNYNAPKITEADYHAFRTDQTLKSSFHKAFDKICTFYGLHPQRTPASPFTSPSPSYTLTPDPSLSRRKPHNWLTPFNHNHLRITRIIRSLRVLGFATEAQLFVQKLLEVDAKNAGVVSGSSRTYWRRAAELELWEAPDPGECDCEWLKEVEGAREAKAKEKGEAEGELQDEAKVEAEDGRKEGAAHGESGRVDEEVVKEGMQGLQVDGGVEEDIQGAKEAGEETKEAK